MIGETISHYTILQKLGEGGMGAVYLAEDLKLDRKVALKLLPQELLTDPQAKARLVQEAKAASAIQDPRIATVYEIAEAEEQPFLAMEYVEGETLKVRVAREGPLPLDQVVDYGLQAALALAEAHARGIVHRDLKSANLMVTPRGQLKVLDFGLARLAGRPGLTKPGTTLGTVAYMSPEQARGELADHRSDIYALGVVLYELATGELPFKGEQEVAVLYALLNEEPEPAGKLRPELPVELEQVITTAMAKAPEARYQDVRELVAELRTIHRQQAEPPSPPSVIRAEARPPKRRISPRRGLVIGLGLVAGLAGVALVWRFLAPREPGPMPPRPTVVVLPFENLGPPEEEYFAEGITEEIAFRLAGIHGLGVIARTSAIQYKHTDKPIKQIGDELGVNYILEGTVRWQHVPDGSSRVRVTPQLIRVADATHLWSERYDAVMADIFSIQSDIAKAVANALAIQLTGAERTTLAESPTENLEAYQAYLLGQYHLRRGRIGPTEEVERARNLFREAVELDPEFEKAWLARWYVDASLLNPYRVLGESQRNALAEEQAPIEDVILAKFPESAGGFLIRASHLQRKIGVQHGGAWYADSLRRSAGWREADVMIVQHEAYASALSVGDFNAALRFARRATAADPADPLGWIDLAYVRYFRRELIESSQACAQAVRVDPSNPIVTAYCSLILANSEDRQSLGLGAYACAETASLGSRVQTLSCNVYALALAEHGQPDSARALFEPPTGELYAYDALIHSLYLVALREQRAAVGVLRDEVDRTKWPLFYAWIIAAPGFDPLRKRTDFQRLVRQVQSWRPR